MIRVTCRRDDVKRLGRGGEQKGRELGDAWEMKFSLFFVLFGASQGKAFKHLR